MGLFGQQQQVDEYSDLRSRFHSELSKIEKTKNLLRDDSGRPLLLFHGSKTTTAFKKFGSPKDNGALRTWFSTSLDYASGYAEGIGKVHVCVASIPTDSTRDFIDLTSTGIDCASPLPQDEFEIEDLAYDMSFACGCSPEELVQPLVDSDSLMDLIQDKAFPGFSSECVAYLESVNGDSVALGFLNPGKHVKIVGAVSPNE